MPYSPKAVANYFLTHSAPFSITPMKMQKLVYYAHAASLALFDIPLIDEPVQAWKNGPVIASLYWSLQRFDNSPIPGPIPEDDYESVNQVSALLAPPSGCYCFDTPPGIPSNDAQTADLLNAILNKFGEFEPIDLSMLTHQPQEAWTKTIQKYGGNFPAYQTIIIDNEDIKKSFVELYLNNSIHQEEYCER